MGISRPNKLFHIAERGAIIIWSLVMLTVSTILLTVISSGYVQSARIAHMYMDLTDSRFFVQDAIDSQITSVLEGIVEELNLDNTTTGAKDELIDKLKSGLEESGFTASGGVYTKKTDIVVANDTTLDRTASKKAEISIDSPDALNSGDTLKVTAVISVGGGVMMVLQQELTFTDESDVDTETRYISHPIFNYVYFSNNYGHLDSTTIIANGDVGANNDFSITDAIINGFISSAGEVYLYGTPKGWPRATYMKKVANEYEVDGVSYYTQVRPTTPISGSNNGVPYSIDWPGGYDPIVDHDATYGDSDNPNYVAPPGTSPKRSDYVKLDLPTYSDSKYNWPNGPTATWSFWYGDCWEYDDEYYSQESSAYGAYFDDQSEPVEPNKADYYPSEVKSRKNGKKTVYYYTFNGKEYTFSKQSQATSSYNNAVKTATANYNAACEKYKTEKAQYDNYLDVLESYNTDCSTYYSQVEAYENAVTDWNTKNEAYQAYQTWISQISGGSLESTITKNSRTEAGHLVVSSQVATVDMPYLSDSQRYISFCQNYKCPNGAIGGSLLCENKYRGSSTQNGKTIYTDSRLVMTNTTLCKKQYEASSKGLWIGALRYFRPTAGTVYETEYEVNDTYSLPKRTISRIEITSGYKADVQPFEYDGNDGYKVARNIEMGSVILIGTPNYPITINGPVYIPGDVIIRGCVQGQGAIYAGRNIHIIGDISYQKAPTWPHNVDDLTLSENTPEEVAKNNAECDLLGLYARGNIIVGDYTAEIWKSDSNMQYLKSYGQTSASCNNFEDTAIGYPSGFNRDYTASDGQKQVAWEYSRYATVPDKNPTSNTDVKYFNSLGHNAYYYLAYYKMASVEGTCKYYETKLGSEVITELRQASSQPTTTDSGSGYSLPSSWFKRLICKLFGPTGTYSGESITATGIDASDVTEIDATLFANHGIFGVVGGTSTKEFRLNGSMICRDEGLLPSFATRFASESDARIWLNWDMRISTETAEGNQIVGVTADSQLIETAKRKWTITVSDWHQLPSSSAK